MTEISAVYTHLTVLMRAVGSEFTQTFFTHMTVFKSM